MKDLYKILGVAEDADEDTIKKSFRKLAKENHPDATGGDKKKTEQFKEVNEAYTVLGDKEKRREYDRLKHAPLRSDGMPEGFDADAFAQVFGGARGGGVHVSSEFGDIGDLFSSLFGGSGGGGRGRPRVTRGPDMSAPLEVTLAEAALGTRRSLRLGSGTIEVQIPPGVESGGRLRIPGKGGAPPRPGGQPGDLHLELRVATDPFLSRNGQDLELKLPLSLSEAILGTKVDVPTVEGTARVTIPPGTSSGAKLRLRGKGIARPDGTRGDQLCLVEIVVPRIKPEDEESRRLVEELDRRTTGAAVRGF